MLSSLGTIIVVAVALASAQSHVVQRLYDDCDLAGKPAAPFAPARVLSVSDDLSVVLAQKDGRLAFVRLAGIVVAPERQHEARTRLEEFRSEDLHVSFRGKAERGRPAVLVGDDGDIGVRLLLEGLARYKSGDELSAQERCVYEKAEGAAALVVRDPVSTDPYVDALRVAFAREVARAAENPYVGPIKEFVVQRSEVVRELPNTIAGVPVLYLDYSALEEKARRGSFVLHKLWPIKVIGTRLVLSVTCYGVAAEDESTLGFGLSGGWKATFELSAGGRPLRSY
jgi:hypothetical protein